MKKIIYVVILAMTVSVLVNTACVFASDNPVIVNINGEITSTTGGGTVSEGIAAGINNITVEYSELMTSKQPNATLVLALYKEKALEEVMIPKPVYVAINGEIPRFTTNFSVEVEPEKYYVKAFFLEGFGTIRPIVNNKKTTSGTELAGNRIIVDGTEIDKDIQVHSFASPKWINVEDNNGYVFLNNAGVSVQREHNNGTTYAVITHEHGENPVNKKYAYVILPNADASQTEEYSRNTDVEIIEQSNNVHALLDTSTNKYYVNVFEGEYTIGKVTLPACSAILKFDGNKTYIWVSDPTQKQNTLSVGGNFSAVSGENADCVVLESNNAVVDVSHKKGATYSFCLTD